jgi:hypothetical protein
MFRAVLPLIVELVIVTTPLGAGAKPFRKRPPPSFAALSLIVLSRISSTQRRRRRCSRHSTRTPVEFPVTTLETICRMPRL